MPNIVDKKVLHEVDVTIYYSHHKTESTTLQAPTRSGLTEKIKDFTENRKPEVELLDFHNYRTITTAFLSAVNNKKWFTTDPQNNRLKNRE